MENQWTKRIEELEQEIKLRNRVLDSNARIIGELRLYLNNAKVKIEELEKENKELKGQLDVRKRIILRVEEK